MRIAIAFIALLVIALAIPATASARIWYIKADGTGNAATIQAGISAAGDWDSVLLAAGTYTGEGNRNIDFLGKLIAVTSESGPEVTVIDCQGLGRGFVFRSGEGSSSVLSGLTILNGTDYEGGGIYCMSSSPTISGNAISGNSVWFRGGGISCEGSSPTISNNTISGSSVVDTEWGCGGGICCEEASPTIRNTIIAFGTMGNAVCCLDCNPTFINCDIYGNAGGDALCGIDGGGNISADPFFCDRNNGNFYLNCTSPCRNNPGYGQIGAFGVACGPTAVENTTWGRIKAMFR
jgi:hypothetical protein